MFEHLPYMVFGLACFATTATMFGEFKWILNKAIYVLVMAVAIAVIKVCYPAGFYKISNIHIYLFSAALFLYSIHTLYTEGTFDLLWRRVHPVSAPTETLRAGQRGKGLYVPKVKTPATLMGTYTPFSTDTGLDVKTETLIRLSYFAFTDMKRASISILERQLRVSGGKKFHAFHNILSESCEMQPALTDIVHPYWRAVNGNYVSGRTLFTELCHLAHITNNLDNVSLNKMSQVGQALRLTPQDLQRAVQNMR